MLKEKSTDKLRILILYDPYSTHVKTTSEHLTSFIQYSENDIHYAPATQGVAGCELDYFDVVIIHYCVRLCYDWHISENYLRKLKDYSGLKIIFIQDEYDHTDTARKWIENLKINVVYSCVPNTYLNDVYPLARFKDVTFVGTLTGYVPMNHEVLLKYCVPLNKRKYQIGYRGRELPYYYGDLCRQKFIIAQRMKKICEDRNMVVDIESGDNNRIYSDNWYEFLGNCRATLGTESGSNVFDFTGEVRAKIEKTLKDHPEMTYEEIHDKYLKNFEGRIKMNQISPRIFESIALKTALILYEGEYSGVIKPNIHYIPLKKDFSNVDDVLEKLADDQHISDMTERAYQDIILTEKFSYKQFIESFDSTLATCMNKIQQRKTTLSLASENNVSSPTRSIYTASDFQKLLSPINNTQPFSKVMQTKAFIRKLVLRLPLKMVSLLKRSLRIVIKVKRLIY